MQKNEKALITGVIIGASVVTAAVACIVHKTIKAAEIHLFKLEGQEDKEELIDSLIPNTPTDTTTDDHQKGDQ